MNKSDALAIVEAAIGHRFKDRKLLRIALTAAGAESENHDGNRKLAWLGQNVARAAIVDTCYEKLSLESLHNVSVFLEDKERLADVADALGVVKYAKLCTEYASKPSKTVKSLIVRALLGAVWRDSENFQVLLRVLQNINPALESVLAISVASSDAYAIDTPTNLFATETAVENVGSSLSYFRGNFIDESESIGQSNSKQREKSFVWSCAAAIRRAPNASLQPRIPQESVDCSSRRLRQTQCGVTTPRKRRVKTKGFNIWESFVAEDTRRCEHHDCANSWASLLSTDTARHIEGIAGDMAGEAAAGCWGLWIGTCSSSAVLALRDALSTLRKPLGGEWSPRMADLSEADRWQRIEELERGITGLNLLRQCQLVQLWKDCLSRTDWVHIDSTVHPGADSVRRSGNPRYLEQSDTAKSAMSQIFPALDPKSPAYKTNYNKLKRLRRLGERLMLLIASFGTGILGLILASDVKTDTSSSLALSDSRLLKISIPKLKELLDFMDKKQGPVLRKFSQAATPIIDRMLEGFIPENHRFPIEEVPYSYIAGLPRGSRPLLACFESKVT